ncbi:MAG: RtcB family protein [Verrucomicrobia bacterium]|nr:RtcB family protein [Verrucomicrobiota bacterium]
MNPCVIGHDPRSCHTCSASSGNHFSIDIPADRALRFVRLNRHCDGDHCFEGFADWRFALAAASDVLKKIFQMRQSGVPGFRRLLEDRRGPEIRRSIGRGSADKFLEERDLLYEEAPVAHKNIEAVIQDLVDAGLVSVIATFRPLLTYKTRKVRR